MSQKIPQFLLSLIWVDQTTFHLPLPIAEVRSRLATTLGTDVIIERPTLFWSTMRDYSVSSEVDAFVIRGPQRRRGVSLVAIAFIEPDPEGTVLKLTIRMSWIHIALVILVFLSLPIWMLFGVNLPLLFRQNSLWMVFFAIYYTFVYVSVVINFRDEAMLVRKLIRQVVLHPPQSHINPMKFSI